MVEGKEPVTLAQARPSHYVTSFCRLTYSIRSVRTIYAVWEKAKGEGAMIGKFICIMDLEGLRGGGGRPDSKKECAPIIDRQYSWFRHWTPSKFFTPNL